MDKQFEHPKLKKALAKMAKNPFKSNEKQSKLVANGAIKAKKPRPFRFPERRPKMNIRQVSRPNYNISPTYVVPNPVVHYAHPVEHVVHPGYPYHYSYPAPVYPGYAKAPAEGKKEEGEERQEAPEAPEAPLKTKTVDSTGRPTYPEWAQEVLGTYRPHSVVYPNHPYSPYGVVVHPHVPDFKEFLNDKYYLKLKSAADKARYHYAFDSCARKGKNWSTKRRYKCFRLMWK